MRKTITAILVGLLLVLGFSTPASADKPAEFTVTTEGITLHGSVVFGNNHNIHLDYFGPDGYLYEERGNGFQGPKGESFVSWSALGVPDGAIITYVHVTGLGKNYGEWEFGKGVTPGPEPEPERDEQSYEEFMETSTPKCAEEEGALGTVVEDAWTMLRVQERFADYVWDEEHVAWVQGEWTAWETVSFEEVENSRTTATRLMTDEEAAKCGLPSTGAPLVEAGIAALVLLAAGGALAFRSRR